MYYVLLNPGSDLLYGRTGIALVVNCLERRAPLNALVAASGVRSGAAVTFADDGRATACEPSPRATMLGSRL